MRARRRAIGAGAGYDGSQISSLWTRRISISSRWPSVTSSPVGAPLISIIVLSAVVVPCTRISSSPQSWLSGIPKRSASWVSPFITPLDWSSAVVGVLSRTTSPSGVMQRRSVNVPPTSTPSRYPIARGGGGSGAHRRAAGLGGGRVDGEREVLERAGQHDAVLARRALDADVLVQHVVEHGLRVAVEGITPAAPAAVVVHDPLTG